MAGTSYADAERQPDQRSRNPSGADRPADRPDEPTGGPTGGLAHRLVGRARSLSRHRRFWPCALLLGYLAQVVFRLVLVHRFTFPSVHADEDSYLVLARVLAGHPTTEMPVGSVIPGGYALLISPALRIAHDPATAYHLVMGINALLNALVFLLAYAAMRRLAVARPLSLLTATAVALMPPVVFYSEFVMTETVFPAVLLCWLITLHGWLSDGPPRSRIRYAVGFGLTAGASMAVHDRGGVVVALTALVLIGALVLRWAPRGQTAVAAATLGSSVFAAKALDMWLRARFEDAPASSVGTQVLDALFKPALLHQTVARTIGQFWYFAVSTWGFGALALAFCCYAVFSRRLPVASRVVAFCMVAALAGIALAAAAGLPRDTRIDNWVYARYLSSLAPAFLVVAVAVLSRVRARSLLRLASAAALFTAVTAETVILLVNTRFHHGAVIPFGLFDAMFLGSDWSALHIWRASAAALILFGACVLVRVAGGRRTVWALTAALSFFAAFATVTVHENVAVPHKQSREQAATGFTEWAGVRPGDNLVMDTGVDWSLRKAQAYEVWDGRVWSEDLRTGRRPPAGATLALLPLAPGQPGAQTWRDRPPGWYLEKTSEPNGWALWRHR
ncbi:hypothetical protein [Streptomyces sp. NPDC059918]|uniref:hypothetical protein n=1 Tax=unclassified Streptomyces TaxID=2593676 RepID=UPI00366A10FA